MIPAFLLSAATSRFAVPVASIVAVCLLGGLVAQCSGRVAAERQLTATQKTLAQTGQALGTCRGNAAGLEAALSRQSEAVEALGQESAARVAASVRAASEARKSADAYRRRADLLLAEPVLAGNVCVLADELLLREAGDVR